MFFKLFWNLNFIIKSQIKSRQINSGSFEICFKQGIFKILENKWNIRTSFSNHFEWTLLGFLNSNQINFKTTLEIKRLSFQFPFYFEVKQKTQYTCSSSFWNKTFGKLIQITFNPFEPFWKTSFRNTLLKSTQTFSFQILFWKSNLILIQSQKCSVSKCKLLQTFEPNFSNFCKISWKHFEHLSNKIWKKTTQIVFYFNQSFPNNPFWKHFRVIFKVF